MASHILGFVAHLKTHQWKATTNPWPKERILSTQLPWREGKYLRFPPCPSWSSNTAMSQPFFPAFFPACKAAASPWLCGNAATTQKRVHAVPAVHCSSNHFRYPSLPLIGDQWTFGNSSSTIVLQLWTLEEVKQNHWSYPNQLRNSAFSASSMGPGLTFKH